MTPEDLAGMDFEALEDLCDDKELETDPDEFDEEDVEKLRKAMAKELGITLPKAKAASKKDTKKRKVRVLPTITIPEGCYTLN